MVPQGSLNHIAIEPTIQESVISAQLHDEGVKIIKQKLDQGEEKYKCFHLDHKGVLWFDNRIVVPKDHQLRRQILDEAHLSKFSIHPGSTKMYQDLRQNYWWTRMKREIAKYVSECDVCQRIKASHLKVAGTLQPQTIPFWKWEDISMDFVVGLPNTSQKHDSIWVIIDRLTKTAHFLPVHTTYSAKKYAEDYLDQIICLHGVPKKYAGFSYHPQTDGQTKRVNQILEDMRRACVIQYDYNWDKCLALAEFSYNNSYQSSLKMAPFEVLYGRRCRTPLSWSQTGELKIFWTRLSN
jgi:hypothetical protein